MDSPRDVAFADLLAGSYFRLIGHSLTPAGITGTEAAHWLYEAAPFAVLAHNTLPDPLFIYGNKAAHGINGVVRNGLLKILKEDPVERYHADLEGLDYQAIAAAFGWDYAQVRADLENLDEIMSRCSHWCEPRPSPNLPA